MRKILVDQRLQCSTKHRAIESEAMFNGRTVNDLKQCLGVVHATSTDEALGVGSNYKNEPKSQIYDNVDLFNVKYKT